MVEPNATSHPQPLSSPNWRVPPGPCANLGPTAKLVVSKRANSPNPESRVNGTPNRPFAGDESRVTGGCTPRASPRITLDARPKLGSSASKYKRRRPSGDVIGWVNATEPNRNVYSPWNIATGRGGSEPRSRIRLR